MLSTPQGPPAFFCHYAANDVTGDEAHAAIFATRVEAERELVTAHGSNRFVGHNPYIVNFDDPFGA